MRSDPWAAKKRMFGGSRLPRAVSKPKMRWRPLRIIWVGLKRACTALGAMVLIMSLMSGFMLSSMLKDFEPKQVALPQQMVLFIPLDGNLGELPTEVNIFDPSAGQHTVMRNFIDALDRAASDSRVKGIYARLEQGGYALAHIQEIRSAIKRFRESGKFAYIYSPSYAETGGLGSYYLASAFEEIWMQPMGTIAVTGINAEMPFLRGVLDKVGVEPQFFQRKEYKSAYENLTHAKMSDANREMTTAMISDIATTILHDISQDRKLTSDTMRRTVDKGLFTAPEAKAVALIDVADYADVLVENINEKVTGDKASDLPYVTMAEYVAGTGSLTSGVVETVESIVAAKPKQDQPTKVQDVKDETKADEKSSDKTEVSKPEKIAQETKQKDAKQLELEAKQKDAKQKVLEPAGAQPKIALVYAVGAIMDSKETSIKTPSVMLNEGVAAADEIAGALLEAADDDTIDAVVLRVESPGGSPVASETILRAVTRVQSRGKPVIVSMGSVAASGGYWISANADRIFVMPTTLTGSIGVLGGKIATQQLWANLGVNWERIQWGENAGMWSMNTPFNEKESERINAMLDNVYVNFIARVAKGRKLDPARVEQLARGRVWTGQQAVQNKLADEFGGLDVALDYTAKQFGVANRNAAEIVVLPKPLTPIEELMQLLEQQVRAGQTYNALAGVAVQLQPVLDQVGVLQNVQGVKVYDPSARMLR